MARELSYVKKVEQSILKTYRKEIYSPFVKALIDFKMINDGDVVGVCISGGKDSMLLAKCLEEVQRHGNKKFELRYIVMNPGYKCENLERIKENLGKLAIDATIFDAPIFEYVTTVEDSPCYLCARMRRGCLYKNAMALGCNKIALGHHFDDVVETTLMSMFYNGKFQTMMPMVKSDTFEGMELIRPLYLVKEKDILAWQNFNEIKFLQCACKFTAQTHDYETGAVDSKRKEMKNTKN